MLAKARYANKMLLLKRVCISELGIYFAGTVYMRQSEQNVEKMYAFILSISLSSRINNESIMKANAVSKYGVQVVLTNEAMYPRRPQTKHDVALCTAPMELRTIKMWQHYGPDNLSAESTNCNAV